MTNAQKRPNSPLVVGLTGGIGSGKSTVAALFSALGVPIIDADVIARDLVRPGSFLFSEIVAHFGRAILTTSGELDRAKLRQIIFQNASERSWLENLLHPLILKEIMQALKKIKKGIVLVVIPLLSDRKDFPMLDKVLVVDAPEALQIARTVERDKCRESEAKAILSAQISRERRLALATEIVTNDDGVDSLSHRVNSLYQQYLRESKSTS